ncbi:MAG: glutamine--tRNA ligase, partial [Oligoflexales bacterium]|nr:glutamine--tRNA ligase [Oligoflexales bacterium]
SKYVSGWDDPRMPTIIGLRRRGYTPASIRDFCERVGITKKPNTIEMALLENCVREDLDRTAPRVMAVLRPIRVVIENYPDGKVEEIAAPNHPKDESMGRRKILFSKVVYIDEDDFREDPPKKYFRLSPTKKVRLRYGYVIECVDVIKDKNTGKVVELRCRFDPETRDGKDPASGKVKGIIHWVSEANSIKAEVRLYDRLFTVPDPSSREEGKDYKDFLNPSSLEAISGARVEAFLGEAVPQACYQFERVGFFCVDGKDSKKGNPVFNRTVTLRDTWAKIEEKE